MVLKDHSWQGKLLADDMWQGKLLTNDIQELRYDAEILLSEIEVAVGQEPDRAASFSKYLDKKFQQLQVEFAKLKVMMDTHSSSKELKRGTSDPTGGSTQIYKKVCTEVSQATNESQKIKIEESQAEESQKIEESQAIDEIEESQASEESQAIEEAIEENLDGSEDSEATLQWGRPPPRRLTMLSSLES